MNKQDGKEKWQTKKQNKNNKKSEYKQWKRLGRFGEERKIK